MHIYIYIYMYIYIYIYNEYLSIYLSIYEGFVNKCVWKSCLHFKKSSKSLKISKELVFTIRNTFRL